MQNRPLVRARGPIPDSVKNYIVFINGVPHIPYLLSQALNDKTEKPQGRELIDTPNDAFRERTRLAQQKASLKKAQLEDRKT